MENNVYELLLVAKIDGADDLIERVEKKLKDLKASNLKSEKLGKKPLAYTIKKQQEAVYTVINFEVEPGEIKGLSDMLRLEQEDLLRYLLLRPDTKKVKSKKGKKQEIVKEEKKEKPQVTVVTKTKVTKREASTKVKKAKGKK